MSAFLRKPGKRRNLIQVKKRDNFYLEGFHAWLIKQGCTERSADSYTSGINRVDEEYFKPLMKGKDLFDALPEAIAAGDAVNWLTTLEAFITNDIEKTVDVKTGQIKDVTKRKNLQDKRCKIRKFIEYVSALQEEYEEKHFVDSESDKLINDYIPEGIQYYTRDDLRKNFRLRILTQDRIYENKDIFFPIRVISRLFTASGKSENKESLAKLGIKRLSGEIPALKESFNDWVKQLVDNVVFHTVNRDYILADIDGLIIDSKKEQAFIKVGNKKFELLSETVDGKNVPMKVKSLSNIHLDHSYRMEDILNDYAGILPTMKRLTEVIRETMRGEKRERKSKKGIVMVELDKYLPGTLDLISPVFAEKVSFADVAYLLPHLLVELNYIGAATSLTAMSDKHNIAKH